MGTGPQHEDQGTMTGRVVASPGADVGESEPGAEGDEPLAQEDSVAGTDVEVGGPHRITASGDRPSPPAQAASSRGTSGTVAVVGGARRRRSSRAAAAGDGGGAAAAGATDADGTDGAAARHDATTGDADGDVTEEGAALPARAATSEPVVAGARAAAAAGLRPGTVPVRRWVLVGLGALALAATVAAVGFGLAWGSLNGQQQAADQVRAVSTAFVSDLTNLSPATVDTRIDDLLAASTGSFASQAKSFFDSGNPPVRQALITAKATEQGQLRSLDVEAVNGSTASVFAVVDVSYQSAKITSVQSDVLRLSLDLVDTAHGWKVNDVTVLTGGSGGVLSPPKS
jgi:hypothetical protein